MAQDITSPLMGASPTKFQMPAAVAPATLAAAAQANPIQAMLAQYGLQMPTPQQIPNNFMFSDQPPITNAQTGQPFGGGGGFGFRHPALATGIENALMGAAMAPGGMPTAGQNMAQVAGALTGIPQWRLQRRIGMTLAPLEIAGNMQNILSQQAQAQGQLLSGQGALHRGYGYEMMGQGRQMEALAMANRVSNLMDMWNKNPGQAQKFMDANADMVQKERLSDPLFYIYSNSGPKEAEKYAKIMAQIHQRFGYRGQTTPEFFFHVLQGLNPKNPKDKTTYDNAITALKLTAPFFSMQARLGAMGAMSNFDPFSGAYTGQGMSPQQSQQFGQQYSPIPGAERFMRAPNQGPELGTQTNPEQPFGNIGQ